jgi:AcrR family transcriptional regulator
MAVADRQTRARLSRQESRAQIVAAAERLVRERSYGELSVEEVMAEAGIGRPIFYRHFDDLGDLLTRACREAIDELYEAQRALGSARADTDPEAVRGAMRAAVAVYARHGPLLRAVSEAAAGDPQIAVAREAMRARFYDFTEQSVRDVAAASSRPPADLAQTARALNLLNEHYLLDAFGREPRVSVETAVQTLTEIWEAVVRS